MDEKVCVCVDAMGGDESPELVCEGIAQALAQDPQLSVLVAGSEEIVQPFCAAHDRARALVSTEIIEMADHPADAVRKKRDSSIVKGCLAVRHGEADGFFSAGSTGAVLAAASLHVGRSKGIKRPAIATPLAGIDGHKTVFLDLGANADCRPEMLVQFAQMGRAYARVLLGVENPCVGLLSNGSEDTKGSEAALAAFAALSETPNINFVGNCEANDMLLGSLDVIVTDGFSGNIALKAVEGTATYIMKRLKAAAGSSKRAALGALLMKPAIKELAADLSGDEYGGAILLGLKAPVLIGHGATSVDAIKNGTLATAAAVRQQLCTRIAEQRS